MTKDKLDPAGTLECAGEISDDQIVASILQHRLRLSLRVVQAAKEAAWRDLPVCEQKMYMRHAELAVMEDDNKRSPS